MCQREEEDGQELGMVGEAFPGHRGAALSGAACAKPPGMSVLPVATAEQRT